MALPFIEGLARHRPDACLHIILKAEHSLVLNLLPEKSRPTPWYYEKNKQSLWSFCWNMRRTLQGIDRYFALPPSLSSALMGILLGARERIGYRSQGRAAFFNRTDRRPRGVHRSQEYYHLMKLVEGISPKFPLWKPSPVKHTLVPPTDNFLVINPNSLASSRRLPERRWVELVSLFEDTDFVLTGAPKEVERVEALTQLLRRKVPQNRYVCLAGKTTIMDLIPLLAQSRGLISNDSGPAHLAHFLGLPTLVFFGAGDDHNTAPSYGTGATLVIKKDLPCAPCLKNTCPLGTLQCMKELEISPEKEKIQHLFQ